MDQARFDQFQALVRQIFLPLPAGVDMVFDACTGATSGQELHVVRFIAPDRTQILSASSPAAQPFEDAVLHVKWAFGEFAKAWLVYCQKNAGWGEPTI